MLSALKKAVIFAKLVDIERLILDDLDESLGVANELLGELREDGFIFALFRQWRVSVELGGGRPLFQRRQIALDTDEGQVRLRYNY